MSGGDRHSYVEWWVLSDQVGTASTAGPVYILGEGGAGVGCGGEKEAELVRIQA